VIATFISNFKLDFEKFVKEYRDSKNWTSSSESSHYNYTTDDREWSSNWNHSSQHDDFFLESYGASSEMREDRDNQGKENDAPVAPSDKFRCQEGWVSIRSELSKLYK